MSMMNIKETRTADKKKNDLMDIVRGNRKVIKFTMNMPEDIHMSLKVLAAKKIVPMTDIILVILSKYIKDEESR